jgi:hypothetical protein
MNIVKVKELFDVLNNNTIKLLYAKKNNDNKKTELYENEKEIMIKIKESGLEDMFINYLISEYKEKIYESVYFIHQINVDLQYISELKRIIKENYGDEILTNHKHDHHNIIYDNKKYMFYEMIEKEGRKIVDEYEN